jgi:hypothetical protein
MATSDYATTSNRPLRFVGRWVVATWVPPIGLCALMLLPGGLRFFPPLWISSLLPLAFWLFVSVGEAWALAGMVPRPRQWAAAAFFLGFIAMLCLLYGSGMFPTIWGGPFRVLAFLAIYAGVSPWPTPVSLLLSGGLFGLVMGLVPILCLRSLRRQFAAWLGICMIAGAVSFGWFAPLHWLLRTTLDRFGAGLPKLFFPLLLLVGPGMALFMLGWLVYSLVTGLALKVLINRQARIDRTIISGAFD